MAREHRAIVQTSPSMAALLVVGPRALYHGDRFEGCMVLRQAWEHEYAYPLPAEYPLALPAAVEILAQQHRQGIRHEPVTVVRRVDTKAWRRFSPVARSEAPRAAERPAEDAGREIAAMLADDAPRWRRERLAAAVANPY